MTIITRTRTVITIIDNKTIIIAITVNNLPDLSRKKKETKKKNLHSEHYPGCESQQPTDQVECTWKGEMRAGDWVFASFLIPSTWNERQRAINIIINGLHWCNLMCHSFNMQTEQCVNAIRWPSSASKNSNESTTLTKNWKKWKRIT